MRILFALPGLHRVDRGAEIAFLSVASELSRAGDEVTLIGSGPPRPDAPYRYIQVRSSARERFERWPRLPVFRSETVWEEATFVPGLLRAFEPAAYDVTVTCAFPFTNWVLRRPVASGRRPAHIFVTQNGDWPAYSKKAEFRFFDCDGLVCINPDYFKRNEKNYRSALIPNGVDSQRFTPGPAERKRFGFPADGPIVLMVSAMIASKNVDRGIRAVSGIPGATLVVAGDGPLRSELQKMASELLPGRYRQVRVSPDDMPALYRSADVFLHLSQDESFGNVYVEALASGVPIVAYESVRTRWILADTGALADPTSPDGIIGKLREALSATSTARQSLVNRSKRFEWAEIARQYRAFFDVVVRERSA